MTITKIAELFDLTGKSAIITGGAMGIGQSIAFRLSQAGAKVMIADIDLDAANKTVEKIKADAGEALAVHADLSLSNDVSKIIQETVKSFGGLDILINNAGISPLPLKPAMETEKAVWEKVLNVNLKGMFLLSQAAAREMIRQGRGGKMVNMTSVAVFRPQPNMIHYNASKAGIVSLTQSLALELSPHNILVNAIAPGGIITPQAEAHFAAADIDLEMARKKGTPLTVRRPLGRWGEPDEIAKVALFLVSAAADYMTGSILTVDGGALLN